MQVKGKRAYFVHNCPAERARAESSGQRAARPASVITAAEGAMRAQAPGWLVYGVLALVSCAAGQGCARPGIAHVTAGPRPAPEAFAAFCRGAPKECAR